jgi:hypothetical protein
MGYEEKRRGIPKTNLQLGQKRNRVWGEKESVQKRSHLEGGQESKLVDAQTELQPNSNQTSSNVTCKHSCSLAKTQNQKKKRERDKEDEEK